MNTSTPNAARGSRLAPKRTSRATAREQGLVNIPFTCSSVREPFSFITYSAIMTDEFPYRVEMQECTRRFERRCIRSSGLLLRRPNNQ